MRIGRSKDDKMGQEDDLYFLISHEMVHNRPRMEGQADGSENANATWYEECAYRIRMRLAAIAPKPSDRAMFLRHSRLLSDRAAV